MDLTETMLPGVGIRYEFETRRGDRMGVIVHRDGHTELVVYGQEDPDVSLTLAVLEPEERDVVAELLGAPRISNRMADLSREVPGLVTTKITLNSTSTYAGRPLSASRCRTVTGCSIVAVVRGPEVVVAPGPDDVLLAGDLLVVIGTRKGVHAVRDMFDPGGRSDGT